jgi:toxin ParE1/3/4
MKSTSGSTDCSAMQAVEVVYRPEAVDDLEPIYRFILDLSRDPDVARAYILRIRERCRRIGRVPQGGTPRDDLEPGLRTVPFERRAVIAYRLTGAGAEITNIFYGGRDFAALYRDRHPDPDAE